MHRNEGGFRQSVPITNIELSVELVEVNVCDIGTITLWCRQAQVIFTQVVVPHAAFVSVLKIQSSLPHL